MSLNMIFVLIVIGGWISGKLAARLRLPGILGMTLWGMALAYFLNGRLPASLWELSPFLRSLALIVILLRAGLGIQKSALRRVGMTAVRMACIPCVCEGIGVALLCRYMLDFAWLEAGMAGCILAAVSPAVVVPSMLTLKEQGYGAKHAIPTMVLAASSLDNVIAVTVFGVFLSLWHGASGGYVRAFLSVPYAVIAGGAVGLVCGIGLSMLFRRYFCQIRATEKMVLMLAFSVLIVHAGAWLQMAGLLAVMVMGFVLLERSEPVAHELAQKLSKLWVFAEIMLFVLIGMMVDVPTAWRAGLSGSVIILGGLALRMLGVFAALSGTRLNVNERLFCAIAYVPKATVQAALGAIPLAMGALHGNVIVSIAVLSIGITSPLGLIGIRACAPRLLHVSFAAENDAAAQGEAAV